MAESGPFAFVGAPPLVNARSWVVSGSCAPRCCCHAQVMVTVCHRVAFACVFTAIFCIVGLLTWAWARDIDPPSDSCPVALIGWDTAQTGKAGQEIEIWIEAKSNRIRLNGSEITLSDLKRDVALYAQLQPPPYLKLDLTRAADCRFATKVRNAVSAAFPCDEANCWQGSREAFKAARLNPNKPLAPW